MDLPTSSSKRVESSTHLQLVFMLFPLVSRAERLAKHQPQQNLLLRVLLGE
jgi:hypothetical protein